MIILKILFFVFVLERLIFKNIIIINMMFDQVIVKSICLNNVTYQFNNVSLPTVTYYLDPIWGTVYRETVENGSDIIDTFDGDMSVLLEKEFVNGNSGLRHLFEYSKGNVSSLSCDNLNFDFSYDKGKLVKVEKFSSAIEESVYDDLVETVYYPNQENTIYSKQFVFDKYNRLKSVVNELENTYSIHSDFNSETGDPYVNVDNGNAKLIISEDKIKGLKSRFSYNNDLLVRKEIASSSDYSDKVSNETFVYDDANRLIEKEFVHNINLNSRVKDVITYEKEASVSNNDKRIKKNEFYINGVKKTEVNNEYDNYKRLKGKTYNFDEEFIVRKDFIYTKNEITNETMSFGDVLTDSVNYVYDNYGRIVSIVSDGKTILYKYDIYGRLVREDNQFIDKTIIYDYNNIGNIINKSVYDYTVNENPSDLIYSKAYQYDNTYKDRLISYGGTSIPYNTLACPTQLNAYNLTWTKGKLTSVYKGSLLTGTERYNYTYNAYGQRLTKVYNKTEGRNPITPIISGEVVSFNKNYIYDHNGRLIKETNTINYYQEGSLTQTIDYLYDGNLIIGIKYNNGYSINTYFFERNILGDVVGIYDTDGNLKVRYLYDAYGNCTISSETIEQALARVNPIRYRGYYYDVETGLYYCKSRYYNPEWCRWISPDSIEYLDLESVNGLNLYCYCMNNPIMYADPSGHSAILIGLIIGAIVGATIGFGTAAYIDYQDDGQIFNGSVAWYDYLGAIILGGAAGAAIGAGIGYIAPQIGSALSSFASTSFTFGGGISLSTGGAATMTAGLTITGAQVLTVAGTLTLAGSLMLMAKDPFIRHLEQGMTEHQKEMFQREIEGLKGNTGRKGNDNLDKNTLRKIADFIKSMFK